MEYLKKIKQDGFYISTPEYALIAQSNKKLAGIIKPSNNGIKQTTNAKNACVPINFCFNNGL